jgi:hypothetical protein
MPEEPYATRRELDQLRQDLTRLDDHGSRGVGAIQLQLTELVKDTTELKTDMSNRFAAHEVQHEKQERERVSGRRWLIGISVTALASIATVGGLLIAILQNLPSHR